MQRFELWIKTYEDKEFRLHLIGGHEDIDKAIMFLTRKYKYLNYFPVLL